MERKQSVGGIFTDISGMDGGRRRSVGICQSKADEAIKDEFQSQNTLECEYSFEMASSHSSLMVLTGISISSLYFISTRSYYKL